MAFDSAISKATVVRQQASDSMLDCSSANAIRELDQRVADRRHTDLARRKSEERHRAFVEHSSEAIWCVDIDPPCPIRLSIDDQIAHYYEFGYLVECNDAMALMYGFSSASEILGVRMSALMPESKPENLEYLRAFIYSDYRLTDAETQEIDREGKTRCFHNNLVGIIEDESIVRAWGTQRDITERKEIENALRQSEERYQLLLNLSPDAIIVHSEGEVTFCNATAARLVGNQSVSDLIGRSIYDFVEPHVEIVMRARVAKLSHGESLPPLEFRCRRMDGTFVDVEMQSVAFSSAEGSAIQAVIRDVSDRKLAEAALKEANERALKEYEELVERIASLGQKLGQARELKTILRALRKFAVVSVPCDGMMISLYDAEHSVRRAAYCWVDGAEIEVSDLTDIPVKDGLTGRAIKSGTIEFDNHYQKALGGNCVVIGKREEGCIPQSALTAPMSVRGRTVGCVEIQSYQLNAYKDEHATAMRMAANLAATAVENLELIQSEREKAEQLRQSQKMDAVGQLAGGVAHDFNNLLTVITGYSEMAMSRMQTTDPMRRNMEEIKKAGDRAATLTRQLLAFSRKQMFQEKVVDLNSIVADMNNMLQRLIGEDVELISLLDPQLWRTKADPGQVEQVLLNLAVNARDAMPRGGKLIIETRNVSADDPYFKSHLASKANRFLMLSVSDTGTGMNDEILKRVFEPFFTTKEVGKGTGLGLATVHGIVNQSGGSIGVNSTPGEGSIFKIYLPVSEGLAEIDAEQSEQEIPPGQGTILLVEDEEMVRKLAAEILKANGYEVLTAGNGIEALRVSSEYAGSIELMITDVVMPQMGGRELAERMIPLRPKTRVLYMSGYTDDAIMRHGILDDHVSFIQKPFSPDSFALKVREVLSPA